MNKITIKSILLIVLLFISIRASGQGYLHASGKKIVNGQGKEVLLKGIGLGGWMLQEPYMLKLSGAVVNQQEFRSKLESLIGKEKTKQFYKKWLKNGMQKSDVDSLAAWGFNSIRLPMHFNLYTLPVEEEPEPGKNTWLSKGFALTDSLLSWSAANEMYLILDLHAAPGGQGHGLGIADRDSTKPSLWQSKANQQKTVVLWKKLADRYKNKKWIGGYDLINEPNWPFDNPEGDKKDCYDTSNGPLKKLYVESTKAIRSVDTNHIIFIEGNCFAHNFKGLLPLWDDNMAISFHKYWDKNNVTSIQKYLDIRTKYKVPLWMGESGENDNKWYREAISLLENQDIGWAWWPLKKVGTNNPFEVKMPPKFPDIVHYWKGEGPKPSKEDAYQAVMQLAENYKTENLIIHHDVLQAMFGNKK